MLWKRQFRPRVEKAGLIDLAVSLVDHKDAALRLIEGAEAVAAKMVDHLWDTIQTVAQAVPAFGGTLERQDIEWFCRNVPRINFRSSREGEGTMDGVPYRWRQDGHMGGSR